MLDQSSSLGAVSCEHTSTLERLTPLSTATNITSAVTWNGKEASDAVQYSLKAILNVRVDIEYEAKVKKTKTVSAIHHR